MEAAAWRVHSAAAAFVLVFPFAGAAVIAATSGTSFFRFLIREDSLLEWLQVAGYAAAVVFGALVGLRLWRAGDRVLSAAYLLFAAGCLFVAGEELSWGQRLFGLEPPRRFVEINARDEINVHNVPAVTAAFKLVLISIGLYGSVVAAAVRLTRRPSRTIELLCPPLFLTGCFFALLAYNCVRLALDPGGFFEPEPRLVLVGLGEWVELCLGLGLGAFAGLGWRRLRFADVAAETDAVTLDAERHGPGGPAGLQNR